MRRDHPVSTYLSDDEKAQLVEWSERTGKSQAHLLREAILEYLDHDRTARIEDEVREINEKLDDVLGELDSDDTHTHTAMSDSLTTARKMIRIIQRDADDDSGVIKESALREIIENYAGVDERTIRKYKDIFRRRGLLFEHPGEPPLWTTEQREFERWIAQYGNMNGRDATETFLADYPATINVSADGYHIEFEETATHD